ncbi:MAG: dUTP diphosphatase [Clostridia bacterium]|nr:dUTP diphosphatase [Clostridia bacterium]
MDQTRRVKIKKLCAGATIPTYGSAAAAGADIYACTQGEAVTIAPHTTALIHTGIALAIPDGLVGLVYARSGIASKRDLAPANKVGVIDSDYRGELMVALHNHGEKPQTVEDGERIAQMVITPYITASFEPAESLDGTERGEGGFGSTGK